MPCIICRQDHRPSKRVELDDLAAPRREQFTKDYFCNWEFHYVCKSCYWRDSLNRGYFGAFAKFFNLCLNYIALFSISTLVFSALLRFKAPAYCHRPVTIAAAVLLVIFCYSRIVKVALVLMTLIGIFLGIFFFGNHTDYFALIPDLTVLTTRARNEQKLKEMEALRKSDPQAYEKLYGKGKPVAPEDPAIAVMKKRDADRQKRLEEFMATFRPYLPFKLNMKPSELGFAARSAAWALLAYVLLLFGLQRLIFPALGIGVRKKRFRGAVAKGS